MLKSCPLSLRNLKKKKLKILIKLTIVLETELGDSSLKCVTIQRKKKK